MADGKKRKHKHRLTVTTNAVPESGDKMAPFVAYFPSGYDPTAAAEPNVGVFRNKMEKKQKRLELVFSPGADAAVDFVGTNYTGEAMAPQISSYAVGVLDKESQTLKIVPIASNKIFRLEPHFLQPTEAEPSESVAGGSDKVERRREDLTSRYGTKKDRDKDKKWKSLNQQIIDPTSDEHMEIHTNDSDMETEVHQDTAVATVRNIPPHDLSADTPDKAYPLDEIISNSERIHLLAILDDLYSEEDFSAKGYPSFVSNRIHKLKLIKAEQEKEKLASILSYITHLVNFWQLNSSRHGKSTSQYPKIPRIVNQKLLTIFMDQESSRLSAEKTELLIEYVLVLTLFVDDFRTDPSDIAKDFKMTVQSLKPYYQQLGCKGQKDAPSAPLFMTLPVPLKFTELKRSRRR